MLAVELVGECRFGDFGAKTGGFALVVEECAVDGASVGIKGYIAPDGAPKAHTCEGKNVFGADFGELAHIHWEQTLVGGFLSLGGHVDVEGVAFHFFAGSVNHNLASDIFVEVGNHGGAGSGDVDCLENLALFVGLHILRLAVFERHSGHGQQCSHHNNHYGDVDNRIYVALLVDHPD